MHDTVPLTSNRTEEHSMPPTFKRSLMRWTKVRVHSTAIIRTLQPLTVFLVPCLTSRLFQKRVSPQIVHDARSSGEGGRRGNSLRFLWFVWKGLGAQKRRSTHSLHRGLELDPPAVNRGPPEFCYSAPA